MQMFQTVSLTVVICLVIGLAACAEDEAANDQQVPSIVLDNIVPYQDVAGTFEVIVTATDDVGVDFVELLVNDQVAATSDQDSYSMNWDTTTAPSGIVSVKARVTDFAGNTAETDSIRVVVVNGGEWSALNEGNDGEFAIPEGYDGTQEIHEKHHWMSPADGASRVIAVLSWTAPEDQDVWEFRIDLGTGNCPHSGETYATSDTFDVSPIEFDAQPDGGFPTNTQLFVHISPMNAFDHLGDNLPFEIKIFTFE